MSFRRQYYTRPAYLQYSTPKQPEYIVDFGQVGRRSDYYRKRKNNGQYVFLALIGLIFISSLFFYGYISFISGGHLPHIGFSDQEQTNTIALVQPTLSPPKVVEGISLQNKEKIYTYTVMNGDSYARLVKRAVVDFSNDHDLTLTDSEINTTVYTIVSGLERNPLHPGDVFTLAEKTINDTLLPIVP